MAIKTSAKLKFFKMDERKHGGDIPQSTLQVILPAYNIKESRKPTADPDSQLRMNDPIKGDAQGRWWIQVRTMNVGSMVKRSGVVSDMLCRRKVDVCALQEVRFKKEGVKFLQGGQKTRYKMFWKGGKDGLIE